MCLAEEEKKKDALCALVAHEAWSEGKTTVPPEVEKNVPKTFSNFRPVEPWRLMLLQSTRDWEIKFTESALCATIAGIWSLNSECCKKNDHKLVSDCLGLYHLLQVLKVDKEELSIESDVKIIRDG